MLVVLSFSAHAETRNNLKLEGKNWNFALGLGVMYGPKYDGSDNYKAMLLPDVSVEYKNGLLFANVWDGIGSYPFQGENYKVGASIGWTQGRDEHDDRENLRGMGNIDMGATVNVMGEYSLGPMQITGKLSTGTEDYGATATVEVGTMFPVTEKLMVMGSVGPIWANKEHMQSYFGVSAAQSARSGYGRYTVESGVKSVGFTVGTFYNITEHWEAKLMIKGELLLGDAADSPITKKSIQPAAFFTTSYNF